MRISETWTMRIIPNADEIDAVEVIRNAVHMVLDKFDPEEGSTVLSNMDTGECFSIEELRTAMAIIGYMGESHDWEMDI